MPRVWQLDDSVLYKPRKLGEGGLQDSVVNLLEGGMSSTRYSSDLGLVI